MLKWACFFTIACGTAVCADTAEQRDKLIGAWQTADSGTRWTFEEEGDAIRVTQTRGAEKIADIKCNTMGKVCDVGHKTSVSFYYNGPRLVQMETRGNDVIKRRFHVSEDGNTLELEIMHISPPADTEKVQLQRVSSAAAR